ncbi:MAG TPA: response regulator [Candidatus Binatia bacterium]|nr:response regulator [Candidatus Binatia bacterium]
MRALIVDDSRATRTIIKKMLSEVGFEVFEAADGVEALRRLKEIDPPDVLLVDWNMPEMNGYDLVRAVRGDAQYDKVPLMMVTSETERGQMAKALAAGANEYVMKPFTKDVITEKLALLGVLP